MTAFEIINDLFNQFNVSSDEEEMLGILDELEEVAPHLVEEIELLRGNLLK